MYNARVATNPSLTIFAMQQIVTLMINKMMMYTCSYMSLYTNKTRIQNKESVGVLTGSPSD